MMLTTPRELYWARSETPSNFDPIRDTDFLKAILRKAQRLAKLSIRYWTSDWKLDFKIPLLPEEQFLLPGLKTITTSRSVSPQELFKCFPDLETAELDRMLPENDALNALAGLKSSRITNLTISIEGLSLRFVEDLGKLTNLVYLQLTTPAPHRDPWNNSNDDLCPRILGVSRLQLCQSQNIRMLTIF